MKIKIGVLCSLAFIVVSFLVFRINLPKIPTIFLYNLIIIVALQEMGFYRGLFFIGLAILLTILASLSMNFHYVWNVPIFFITFLIVDEQIKKSNYHFHIIETRMEEVKENTNLLKVEYNRHKKDAILLEKKEKKYKLLKEASSILSSIFSLEHIAGYIVDNALQVIAKSESALLFLVDTEKQELNLAVSRMKRDAGRVKAKKGGILDDWVFKHGQCILVDDIKKDFRFAEEEIDEHPRGFRSVIACPLMQEKKMMGVVRLEHSRPYNYTSEDLRLLDILCDMGAVSIENAMFYKQTLDLAVTDGLTGLYLRRYFLDRLKEELSRSLHMGFSCSLLMIDIDNFKSYNDKYGHAAGDIVLKILSDLLKSVSQDKIIARYGGEEFAVLLPETSKSYAEEIAGNIRDTVRKEIIELRRTKTNITVSIGVASFPEDAKVLDGLILKSDERLYMAKRMGKDRVVS